MWKRCVGGVIDLAVCFVLAKILVAVLNPLIEAQISRQIAGAPHPAWTYVPYAEDQARIDSAVRLVYFLGSFFLLGVAYHVILETRGWRATLGKKLLGIEVVGAETQTAIKYPAAILRIMIKCAYNPFLAGTLVGMGIVGYLLGFNEPLVHLVVMGGYLVAVVLAWWSLVLLIKSKERISLHDKMAKSIVVAHARNREPLLADGIVGYMRALFTAGYRKCPECAEMIRGEARKCRFCGALLTPISTEATKAAPIQEPTPNPIGSSAPGPVPAANHKIGPHLASQLATRTIWSSIFVKIPLVVLLNWAWNGLGNIVIGAKKSGWIFAFLNVFTAFIFFASQVDVYPRVGPYLIRHLGYYRFYQIMYLFIVVCKPYLPYVIMVYAALFVACCSFGIRHVLRARRPEPSHLRVAKESSHRLEFVVVGLFLLAVIAGGVSYLLHQRSKRGDVSWSAKPGQSEGEVRVNPNDGLKYVWIPPGTFMMGCSPGDTECRDDEKPRHQVNITKGFWMGQTEVTVGAYKRFAGATGRQMPREPVALGGWPLNPGWGSEAMPIVNVNRNDAHDYCMWAGARLPTEAEWEYAARGGSTEVRYASPDEIAWYWDNSGGRMHPVGEKRANGFGLYDMLGSVWEWVSDWYGENYYQNSPSQDPVGPAIGSRSDWGGRVGVLRGGSWYNGPEDARVSRRRWSPLGAGTAVDGFRCGGEVSATVPAGQEARIEAPLENLTPKPGEGGINPKDGLKYVWIPAGTFMMGCSSRDNGCNTDEEPSHQVTLTKGFWIGQTEVTVGAYKRFAAATGRQMPGAPTFNSGWANDNMPITMVNWNDAHDYCAWAGGRLPTEAEWEYAARGGSTEALYGPIDEIAWHKKNSGGQTHEVAQKRANGFGLFDVLGNVSEWVNDLYDQDYYQNSPSQDPPGPVRGEYRVSRGGSWTFDPNFFRVSFRISGVPAWRQNEDGVRCGGEVFAPVPAGQETRIEAPPETPRPAPPAPEEQPPTPAAVPVIPGLVYIVTWTEGGAGRVDFGFCKPGFECNFGNDSHVKGPFCIVNNHPLKDFADRPEVYLDKEYDSLNADEKSTLLLFCQQGFNISGCHHIIAGGPQGICEGSLSVCDELSKGKQP